MWISVVNVEGVRHDVNMERVAVVRRCSRTIRRQVLGTHGQYEEVESELPIARIHIAEADGSLLILTCEGQQARNVFEACEQLAAQLAGPRGLAA